MNKGARDFLIKTSACSAISIIGGIGLHKVLEWVAKKKAKKIIEGKASPKVTAKEVPAEEPKEEPKEESEPEVTEPDIECLYDIDDIPPEEPEDAQESVHVITEVEFLNDPGYRKLNWRYYVEECVMTDNDDLPIISPEDELGEYLQTVLDYAPSRPGTSLFFRNEDNKTDLEVGFILPLRVKED